MNDEDCWNVRLDGKTVVVTGASSGIGRATACELARRGARVILGCRDESAGLRASQDIAAETGNNDVHFRLLDLASLASVRSFSDEFLRLDSRLDILVNNAGVFSRKRRETEDGFELHFAVNHLGHFLLTYLLLERLVSSAPSRIVTLSSKGHRYGKLELDDVQFKRRWSTLKAYCCSKTENVLFSTHLARLLQGTGVSTYCVHPGIVDTNLARDFDGTVAVQCFTWVWSCVHGRLMTPLEGARTTLYCCLDPNISNISGRYYSNCREKRAESHATSEDAGWRLWQLSAQLCDVSPQPLTAV